MRQDFELTLAHLLRLGVVLSAIVVATGGLYYTAHNARSTPNYAKFHSEPPDMRSPRATLREAEHFDSQAVIMLGLLILISTPIFRVAFTVFAFARDRDWPFCTITLIVLSVLLYSVGH